MLVLACFALFYRQVILEMVKDWLNDDNYSHGLLVFPLAAWFAWERRHRFAKAVGRPALTGILLFAPAILISILDMHPFINRLAMLLCVTGSIVFLFGWARLRAMAFPMAFLLLMIPIPAVIFNPIAFPLQLISSHFGEWTLSVCRIPVLREGNIIQLGNVTLEVAEACSGIRSLISLLTLGIVYGYFTEPRIWIRVVLSLASVPVAIAANALRVAGTGFAAHIYGAAAAEGYFHLFSGWLVFVSAFAMLFVFHRILLLWNPVPQMSPGNSAAEGNVEGPLKKP
jgi:exosortase